MIQEFNDKTQWKDCNSMNFDKVEYDKDDKNDKDLQGNSNLNFTNYNINASIYRNQTISITNKNNIVTKLKDIDDSEKLFARQLFDGLFTEADAVSTKDLGEDFAYAYRDACTTVEDDYGDITPASTSILQTLGGIVLYFIAIAVPCAAVAYMVRPEGYIFGALLTGVIAAWLTGRIRKSYKRRLSGKKTGSRVYRIILWAIDAAVLLFTAAGVGSAFGSTITGGLYFICFAACQFFNVYCDRISDTAF